MAIAAKIGIIGGNGWLGNAIAAAAVGSGLVDPDTLTLSGRSDKRGAVAIPGAHWTRDNAELATRSDIVVLSVRPDQFPDVRIDARGKLVVSVMAGIPARRIVERTGAEAVVRAMPNAAASIRKSFTPWFALPAVPDDGKRLVQAMFDACGEAAEVSQEPHLDYCAGMTGTGAAYPALLAQALIEHAVAHGLPATFARRAAQGVLVNASQLMAGSVDPASIVREMIDYRGMTAAALETMIDHGFKTAVDAGLDAAAAKGAAMGSGLDGAA